MTDKAREGQNGDSQRWVLWVCPECGSAMSENAAAYVPSEFMACCRHAAFPGAQNPPDIGRNVQRERVEVVRA